MSGRMTSGWTSLLLQCQLSESIDFFLGVLLLGFFRKYLGYDFASNLRHTLCKWFLEGEKHGRYLFPGLVKSGSSKGKSTEGTCSPA